MSKHLPSMARICQVHNSWRVRVFGHAPKFFAFQHYGGETGALRAARAWRDERWDGTDRRRKLTTGERMAIIRSKKHYTEIAADYGISPNYVHRIRREAQ